MEAFSTKALEEAFPDFENDCMEKYGYYGHLVSSGDLNSPTGCNFHTHGFWKSWKHPDIQIVIPVPQNIASPLFNSAKEIAMKGGQIVPGVKYSFFLEGYDIEFAWAVESGRDVLRMILPDKEGITEKGKIAEPYNIQWEGTNETVTCGTYVQN